MTTQARARHQRLPWARARRGAGQPRGVRLRASHDSRVPYGPLRPTLVLAGDDDPLIPLVNGRIMHRLIAGGELHVYRGGHLDLIAEPDRLAPVIERFLRACACT